VVPDILENHLPLLLLRLEPNYTPPEELPQVLVLSVGMEDCSKLPAITEELLRRGFSEGDVRKVLGKNVLCLMGEVMGGRSPNPPLSPFPTREGGRRLNS
jgi:microsomal dipeptidase-like Zn-dependent dipeptidase